MRTELLSGNFFEDIGHAISVNVSNIPSIFTKNIGTNFKEAQRSVQTQLFDPINNATSVNAINIWKPLNEASIAIKNAILNNPGSVPFGNLYASLADPNYVAKQNTLKGLNPDGTVPKPETAKSIPVQYLAIGTAVLIAIALVNKKKNSPIPTITKG